MTESEVVRLIANLKKQGKTAIQIFEILRDSGSKFPWIKVISIFSNV